MERSPTGIKGLDELINGGIPKGSSVLVSGGTGCGKTIFAMQYIYNGAKEHNEPGLFVTVEGSLKNITWNMQSFNWDIKALQDQNLMKIYKLNLGHSSDTKLIQDQIDNELNTIASMVEEIGATRLVLDSTTAFGVWMGEHAFLRSMIYRFCNSLKELNCTTVLTSEIRGSSKHEFSAFGVEEFVADGVIALYFVPPNRSIFVRKMRGTKHSKSPHSFEIGSQGILVKPRDEMMWEAIK